MKQRGAGCGSAFAGVAELSVARNAINVPVQVELANPVVIAVCDVQVTRNVKADAGGTVQPSLEGGAPVAGQLILPVASDCGGNPIRHLYDDVLCVIGDIESA